MTICISIFSFSLRLRLYFVRKDFSLRLFPFRLLIYPTTAVFNDSSIDYAIWIILVKVLSLWQSKVVSTSSGKVLFSSEMIASEAKLMSFSRLEVVEIWWHIIRVIAATFLGFLLVWVQVVMEGIFWSTLSRRVNFSFWVLRWVDISAILTKKKVGLMAISCGKTLAATYSNLTVWIIR